MPAVIPVRGQYHSQVAETGTLLRIQPEQAASRMSLASSPPGSLCSNRGHAMVGYSVSRRGSESTNSERFFPPVRCPVTSVRQVCAARSELHFHSRAGQSTRFPGSANRFSTPGRRLSSAIGLNPSMSRCETRLAPTGPMVRRYTMHE